ncbi:hypothetical protein HQN87_03685 [Paenibacillus tritici]|uniref:F5/8 type C domain-containing protein n=1 Tax=Paenibacillus tritici TaxID=1873425 RepID=A0ABX2DIX1_9BACL|nr:discoidin domain-containing protein [Paenibacillus tritici]NQX44425.1 hypothetical protein [Paenibacillus tritici]
MICLLRSKSSYQANGIQLVVDMAEEQCFNRITIDNDIRDNPGGFRLFVSDDDVRYGDAIAEGCGQVNSAQIDILFPQQKARFIKLVLADPEDGYGRFTSLMSGISRTKVNNPQI